MTEPGWSTDGMSPRDAAYLRQMWESTQPPATAEECAEAGRQMWTYAMLQWRTADKLKFRPRRRRKLIQDALVLHQAAQWLTTEADRLRREVPGHEPR